MSTIVQPLGTLLTQTVDHLKTYATPIAIGAIAFGLIIGGVQTYFGTQLMTSFFSTTGIEMEADDMQKMMQRMQAGDQQARAA